MTQFARRAAQPLRPDSYRRLARLVRQYADRLDESAEGEDARQKKARTDAVNGLHSVARSHWHRHHGRRPAQAEQEAFARQLASDVEAGL